jgi:Tol biopolymer transport system component
MLGTDSGERFVAWGSDGATWITSSRVEGDASVYIRSLAGGDRFDLGSPCDGCRLETPGGTWSADQDSFAGIALDMDGRSRPVVHNGQGWVEAGLVGRTLGWIEAGSVLVAAVEPGGQTRLVSWSPRSSGLTDVAPLSVDRASALFALSPDGRLLALSDRNTGIDVLDLSTGQRTVDVARGKAIGGDVLQLAWSPDSTRLAFVSGRAAWTVNSDGSDLRQLRSDVFAGLSWQPVWP